MKPSDRHVRGYTFSPFVAFVVALCALAGCGDESRETTTERQPLSAIALDYVSELHELDGDIVEQAQIEPGATPEELATIADQLLELRSEALQLRDEIKAELPPSFAAREPLVAAANLSAAVAGDLARVIDSFVRLSDALARAGELAAAQLQRLEQGLDALLARLDQLSERLEEAFDALVDALRTVRTAETADPERVSDLRRNVRQTQEDADEPVRRLREVAEEEGETAVPAGPIGPLTASSVGPVELGMTEAEVEQLFGQPDSEEEVNFGAAPVAPQVDWIWTYDDGDFRLNFETDAGTVTGYTSETSQLETTSGVAVGDSFAPIEERYGGQLVPAPIGADAFLLSEGKPGTYPALTFSLQGDRIISIQGGEPQAAGE